MISIEDKASCCGCSACAQRCPKQCISLHEDEEGFLYPRVDQAACIQCGLCERVCPASHRNAGRRPLEVFAAKNPNEEVRMQSSSGGIFTMLATHIIEEGGVVFGACFNSRWEVEHQYTETQEGLARFRGSKYVQSKIGSAYKEAEQFLKDNRKVLFSGSPCQVAGLKRYLRKDYPNLLTVDFICHGVPSPGVLRTYLQGEIDTAAARQSGKKNTVLLPSIPLISERDGLRQDPLSVKSISFRDKRKGWKKYGFALQLSKASAAGEENSVWLSYSPLDKNLFLRGFLRDLYLRPSCHACPAKQLRSGSDLTLGDWWGIESLLPEIDDDRGVSAVTVNTELGKKALHAVDARLYPLPYEELALRNPALVRSAAVPENRKRFFAADGLTFEEKTKTLAKVKWSWRRFAYRLVRAVTPRCVRTVMKQILSQ